MGAQIWQVEPRAPSSELIHRAADFLRRGELVAFPTETVYGLGALALNANFVERIFAAKGRPPTNPLIVHVGGLEDARALGEMTPLGETLANALWPGPITLVVARRPEVPDIVTAGGSTVALRAPSHPVARALLAAAGAPIAAPSANRSQSISPTTAEHVLASLGDRIALILDGGSCAFGIESTVVDVTGDAPIVLRPGSIDRATIESVAGVKTAPRGSSTGVARSPGLAERHYAPRAALRIVDGDQLANVVLEARTQVLSIAPRAGDETLPAEPNAYAAGLYAALHRLDSKAERIVVEAPPRTDAWAAVWDRLRRAAHEGA